jgi:hypothetical protein
MMTSVSLLALSILAVGCQSYKAGLEVICNAPAEVEKKPEWQGLDPASRMSFMAQMIDDNLSNGDARKVFEALAYADPGTKALMLQKEAQKEGIDSCPMAEFFVEDGKPEPSHPQPGSH